VEETFEDAMKGRLRLRNPVWGIIDLVDMDTPESNAVIVQYLRTLKWTSTDPLTHVEYLEELQRARTT
jgi:hypothetical protein